MPGVRAAAGGTRGFLGGARSTTTNIERRDQDIANGANGAKLINPCLPEMFTSAFACAMSNYKAVGRPLGAGGRL